MKPVILVSSLFAAQIVFAPAFAAPGGSYTRTCRGIVETGYRDGGGRFIKRLAAECQNRQGGWGNTFLDNYNSCKPGTITNNDGNLTCRR